MSKLKLQLCFQALIYWSVLNISDALVGTKIHPAGNHDFPFIVSIGDKVVNGIPGHYHFCTGSLISREHVLTAAHCFDESTKLEDIQVSVGSADNQDGQKYDVDLAMTYEEWAELHNKPLKFDDNDVAIVRLAKKVDDPGVTPAVATFKKARELYDKDAETAGWGVSNTGEIPNRMEEAELHVENYTACMDHVNDIMGRRIIVPQNFLCTLTNEDALIQSGDSGGPLFIGNQIIAINGATFPEDKPDDDPNVQNVHVQLAYYEDFIEDMLNSPRAADAA